MDLIALSCVTVMGRHLVNRPPLPALVSLVESLWI